MDFTDPKDTKEYDIFRVYRENHPEDLTIKPTVVEQKDTVDFTPKVIPQFRSTDTVNELQSIAPQLQDEAMKIECIETINNVTDANEMIKKGMYEQASFSLGRELSDDEIRLSIMRKMFQSPQKKLLEQLNNQEELKKLRDTRVLRKVNELLVAGKMDEAEILLKRALTEQETNDKLVSQLDLTRLEQMVAEVEKENMKELLKRQLAASSAPTATVPTSSSSSSSSSLANQYKNLQSKFSGIPSPPSPITPHIVTPRPIRPISISQSPLVPIPMSFPSSSSSSSSSISQPGLGLPPSPTSSVVSTIVAPYGTPSPAPSMAPTEVASPAPTVVAPVPLGFYYVDKHGNNTMIDDAKRKQSGSNKALYPKDELAYIGSKMLDEYKDKIPSLTQTLYFLNHKSLPKSDIVTAGINKAIADIVNYNRLNQAGQVPLGGHGLPKVVRKQHTRLAGWIPMGDNFQINLPLLKDSNIFTMLYKTTGQKPPFANKRVTISDGLKNALVDYLEGRQMNTVDLKPDESDWLKMIFTKSRISKPKAGQPDPLYWGTQQIRMTPKAMNDKLKIMIGEMLAGNDNIEGELTKHVKEMRMRGWIDNDLLIKIEKLLQ